MKVNRKKSVEIQEFDHNKENELPINAALDAIATPSGPGKPLENVKTVKDLLNERKEANESDLQKAKKKAHRQKRMLQVLATIAIIGLLILSPEIVAFSLGIGKVFLSLKAAGMIGATAAVAGGANLYTRLKLKQSRRNIGLMEDNKKRLEVMLKSEHADKHIKPGKDDEVMKAMNKLLLDQNHLEDRDWISAYILNDFNGMENKRSNESTEVLKDLAHVDQLIKCQKSKLNEI